jgi:hypothetical protein
MTMVATWLPLIVEGNRRSQAKPLEKAFYIAVSTFVYLSSLVAETAAVLAFAITGRAYFSATYDAADGRNSLKKAGRSSFLSSRLPQTSDVQLRSRGSPGPQRFSYYPNSPLVFLAEFLLGWAFLVALFKWRNLWFAAQAVALISSQMLQKLGLRNALVRMLAIAPFLGIVGLFLLIGWQLLTRR